MNEGDLIALLAERIRHLEALEDVETGDGPPTHQAGEGTLYWDYTGDHLYVNNCGSDGAGSWTLIGGSALAAYHNICSLTHTDTTPAAVVRGDLLTGQGAAPATRWTRLALGAVSTHLESDGTDFDWQVNITMADGATIGQAAGPLVTFDDTNNFLEITGCYVGIRETTPTAWLHIDQKTTGVPCCVLEADDGGELATPDNEIFRMGHWNAGTATFTERLHMDILGDFGIGLMGGDPTAQLHVKQHSFDRVQPVLYLHQTNVSQEFTRYQGTAAAGVLTQSIVDEGDQASETREGWLKVYVIDDGNQIADQAYFVPIYTLSA